VILIPAHDEARVIAKTIDSIRKQEYPSELFSVHVVADNCTDATADIATRHGAEVHERFDPVAPGKGPALEWLLGQLADCKASAVVVLDADTSMAPGFLSAIDHAIADGGSAWQAYYTVRDPESSPATALRRAALALRHYVRPLGRTAVGGSCGLFGNGMVFRRELLADRQFSSHLTEDVEFQLELLLDGVLVGFVPEAVIEAEMPTTLDAARTQNERWELGRLQLARSYVPKLLRGALRAGTPHRVALADAALDQLVPPLSVLAAGTTLTTVVATVLPLPGRSRGSRTGATLAWVAMLGFALHVVGGLRLARMPRSAYLALLRAPRLVVWKVALWVRVLLRPHEVTWRRTTRNDPHPAA
jgi:cellulose synthase/poly-beta-1,6-N-acetylglucosamine synthase-like glycosyltransferase